MIRNKIFKLIIIVVIVLLAFNVGVLYGQKQLPFVGPGKVINQNQGKPEDVDFELFWDTWRLLEEKYSDPSKIDKNKMLYGAISGMVKSLDDPYTAFMDPEDTKKFAEELNGTFEGIGAPVGIRKGILTIVDPPISDSPAERAGLKPLDKILKINETETTDLTIDEAVSMIRGPKGTVVTLTILREKETDTREIKVTRDTIIVKGVELSYKDSDKGKIAVLKISRFGEDTFNDVNTAANDILAKDAKGIVLDLRGNPGGLLNSAVDIAGVFLPPGQTVTIESYNDKNRDRDKTYKTRGDNKLGKLPIVILANGGSASASEILAGALHDNRGVRIIGEKTFGKGSVQELEDLKGKSSIKITVARWLTPLGKNINKDGIKPDIEIKMTIEDYEANKDPQLDKAVEVVLGN